MPNLLSIKRLVLGIVKAPLDCLTFCMHGEGMVSLLRDESSFAYRQKRKFVEADQVCGSLASQCVLAAGRAQHACSDAPAAATPSSPLQHSASSASSPPPAPHFLCRSWHDQPAWGKLVKPAGFKARSLRGVIFDRMMRIGSMVIGHKNLNHVILLKAEQADLLAP